MHDCLIIGGGVIGLSLAYELSRQELTVRVIDRGLPGKEASWAGAGILPPANPATAVHPLQKLRALSFQLHPRWAASLREESGIDTGYRKCGGLYLARSAGEAASLHGFKGMLDEEHVPLQRLSDEELLDREPALHQLVQQRAVKAAYFMPDEAQLRNPDHLAALLACCKRVGVRIDTGVEASAVNISAGRISSIETSDGRLSANQYCLTSGAWTHMLLRKMGIRNGIMPVRGQMVMFRCPRKPMSCVINEGPRYLVPRDDGRVLVGSTEEEVGFDNGTTQSAIEELTGLAGQLLNELTPDRVEKTWAGLRPGSFDGFPYLGSIPQLENGFVAAGHHRSGLQMSPGSAVVMSQLMRGEPSQIDLTPFRVGRG